MIDSIYLPRPAEIVGMCEETSDTKSFELKLKDGKRIDFIPGQYLMISAIGEGEFPVSFLTSPTEEKLAVCVKRMGKVTTALHRLEPGETVWVRGPYGNGFPTEDWRNKKLWLIGGGIGLPPENPALLRFGQGDMQRGEPNIWGQEQGRPDQGTGARWAEKKECQGGAVHRQPRGGVG